MQDNLLTATGTVLSYSYHEILLNMVLSTVLGVILSAAYRYTHKGLSYSQSFTQTILFVSVIVAIIMMVIGSSLARAFALVGALSIIRFRTVVKDTKDISFIFAALAVGMAAGTSNYFLAVAATLLVTTLALAMQKLNYGALYKSEFILRFVFDQNHSSTDYVEKINEHAKRSNMLHIEPSADGQFLKLTYDITLKDGLTAEKLAESMGHAEGTSDVVLIASKSDVDY